MKRFSITPLCPTCHTQLEFINNRKDLVEGKMIMIGQFWFCPICNVYWFYNKIKNTFLGRVE